MKIARRFQGTITTVAQPGSPLLKAFFAGCSPEALRYRFMSSIKGPSDSMLDYLAGTDGWHHFALSVTQGQGDDAKIVAESRYVIFKDRPYVAEIAFLVLDEMQRRGIATILMHELMEIACSRGGLDSAPTC